MSVDIGLMLAQALPQIVGGANVEMTGHSKGFKNIDVVHGWFCWSASGAAEVALQRGVPFALWVGRVDRGSQRRGLPRCSPGGTSGRNTAHSDGFGKVNVVHGKLAWSACGPLKRHFGATLSPFGLVTFIGVAKKAGPAAL